MNETTANSRSYWVREEIAKALGKPLHQDFSTPGIPVVMEDGSAAVLTSTSNAGFRGIEGHFARADGSRFSMSLGRVARWAAR